MAVRRRSISVRKISFQNLKETYHGQQVMRVNEIHSPKNSDARREPDRDAGVEKLSLHPRFDYFLKTRMGAKCVKVRVVLDPLPNLPPGLCERTFQQIEGCVEIAQTRVAAR